MPNVLSTFTQLQESTDMLFDVFFIFSRQLQLPDYKRLQNVVNVFKADSARYLPELEDDSQTAEHHELLMGAVFYQYFLLAESNDDASAEKLRSISNLLGINENNQPDAYSIVVCCRAYHRYLEQKFITDIPAYCSSEISEPLAAVFAFLDELVTRHLPEYTVIQKQHTYLWFIQSFRESLFDFSLEMDEVIDALRPVVEDWVKEHGSLDYFDMARCVAQIETSELMRYMMQEYYIVDQASLNNWEYLLRSQSDLCNQYALFGAYVFSLAQANPDTDKDLLSTLGGVLAKCRYNDEREKKHSLALLAAFVELSDMPKLDISAWVLKSFFEQEFKKLCAENGAGLHETRRSQLIKYETKQLSKTILNLVYSQEDLALRLQQVNSSIPIGKMKFQALLEHLRSYHVPLVHLIEGLLIEGRIPVLMDQTDSPEQHLEHRTHDAISLYGQAAAADRYLRPFVNDLLAHIKSTTAYPSVRARLGFCDLSASERYADRREYALPPIKSVLFFKPEKLPVMREEARPVCSSNSRI